MKSGSTTDHEPADALASSGKVQLDTLHVSCILSQHQTNIALEGGGWV